MGLTNELIRKTIHASLALGCGVLGTYGPRWGVMVCAVALFLAFAGARSWRRTRRLYAVPRISYGEFYFLAGIVASAFIFLPHTPVAWQGSMLVLALADPLAALVGRRFGTHTYHIYGEMRSVEGSAACLVVSGAILHLFGAAPVSVAAGSIILAWVEAMAPRGSDNLFLPLAAGALFLIV